MKQRNAWSVVVVTAMALALTACGSETAGSAGKENGKLVVWDWKSSDKVTASYIALAKVDFREKHPGVTVEFVSRPYDQYYAWLDAAIKAGTGPDVALLNGGGQVQDRVASLVPVDEYLKAKTQQLVGWDAFRKDGKTYAAPVTLQGHPIYYNMALYKKAGLDPERPPTTWRGLVSACAKIKKATGAACFSVGNKEGIGIQFFMSGMGPGILTPQEYDDWIAGNRNWNSPHVKKIFQLWKEMQDKGLTTKRIQSTTLFTDTFKTFEAGKAANVIGLMSDIGHWKDFGKALGTENIGVMAPPVVSPEAKPMLAYDGGIGYGVLKGTKNPALAADLLASLTATEPLHAFYIDAGAVVSDPTVQSSMSGPAVSQIMGELSSGKPTLHVALSAKVLDLMGKLSQQLLSGKITVEEVVKQLALADQSS